VGIMSRRRGGQPARRLPRADTLAGEREPTPPRRVVVDVPDDAQAARGPDPGARVAELESCQAGTGGRAGGPAAGTGDGLRHALARSRGRYDGRTLTPCAGYVTPESATHDAMLVHGASGGSLG